MDPFFLGPLSLSGSLELIQEFFRFSTHGLGWLEPYEHWLNLKPLKEYFLLTNGMWIWLMTMMRFVQGAAGIRRLPAPPTIGSLRQGMRAMGESGASRAMLMESKESKPRFQHPVGFPYGEGLEKNKHKWPSTDRLGKP